jgi:hypothetical protein
MRYTRADQEFYEQVFPSLVYPLVKAGILRREHAADFDHVRRILYRKRKFAIKRMRMGVAIELTFVDQAEASWKNGHKEVAIVLLATALEQALNGVLRSLIELRGIDPAHTTELIRSHNTVPKLTWFFEMFSGSKLPETMRREVQRIFEIRNAIVHYKAAVCHVDDNVDSYSLIRKDIIALGRLRVRKVFDRFYTKIWGIARRCDPSLDVALLLGERLCEENREKSKKTGKTKTVE